MDETLITGGCLCGAVRYAMTDAPLYMGYCCCADCRKASGSGFAPFIGVAASAVSFSGETSVFTCKAANGGDSDRNFCPQCGSLLFGGIDDPSKFQPTIAIFNRDRPDWVILPPGLTVFETMPG